MKNTAKSLELDRKLLGQMVTVTIDRPLGTKHPKHGFIYEVNYGYIKGIKAPDGDDLDAYFLGFDKAIESGEGVCIAIAHRSDDDDDKLIVTPSGLTLTDEEILQAIQFQEQWFKTVIIRE